MVTLFTSWSCGWKKPCTMQLRLVVYLRIYKVLYIPGGKTRRMSSTHSDRQTARLPEVPIFGFPGLAKGDFASCVHIQCLKSVDAESNSTSGRTWYTWFGERSCVLKNFMPVWKTSAKTSVQVVFFSTCSKTESVMADSLCTFDENCIPSLVRGRPWVPFALSHPLQGLSPRGEWWAKSIAKSLVPPIEAGGESGRENLGNTGPFLRLKPRFKSSNEPPLFDTFWVLIRWKNSPHAFLGDHFDHWKEKHGKKNPSLAAQLVADFSIHAGIITKNSFKNWLVGGFNPSEKKYSKWVHLPQFSGWKLKKMKPPPSWCLSEVLGQWLLNRLLKRNGGRDGERLQ